ncbi:hypothetical protein B9T35_14435 [Acinetobacter sp. ANC 3832]|nr:hypothetical protein B9T35_14435 [Acinetobacter sp. ANC 3832]
MRLSNINDHIHVNLDESDEFGTFIFRITGFNSIRTLAGRWLCSGDSAGFTKECEGGELINGESEGSPIIKPSF